MSKIRSLALRVPTRSREGQIEVFCHACKPDSPPEYNSRMQYQILPDHYLVSLPAQTVSVGCLGC